MLSRMLSHHIIERFDSDSVFESWLFIIILSLIIINSIKSGNGVMSSSTIE